MGRFRSTCGIILVLFTLWIEKIQCPIVNTQPESNLCVLRTPKGVDIQASLKPSLNAKDRIHQTLDLSNAKCCFNPDKKCALTEHLNVTLTKITSLLKYPIQPLWMVVNNKRIPRFGVWDELWYSFYEIGEPSLTQNVDIQITRGTSFNTKEAVSVYLNTYKSVSPTTQTETSTRLVISQQRSSVPVADRILPEDVFLLIPELRDNLKKDSQTRRGPRDYLVLDQSLFDFPNSDCFNEKTRFLSLVLREHRPCVEASSVDLEKQPYDFYVKEKVKEIRNEPTEFFLSSFGTLHDTATTSRHRSSVIFISQQPLILHIFIPNEETSSRSTAFGFLSTSFDTISMYSRHLGSFFKDQFTLGTAIIYDACDIIARYFQLLMTFLKGQWSSAVGVLYSGADRLCDLLGSFDKLDRISLEQSIDYRWNLIWSYIDHVCQKIGVLTADGNATEAAGFIAFFVFSGFPLLLLTWVVTSLRNPADIEDLLMLANENGMLVLGRDPLVADFMEDAFNIINLPPRADDTIVNGTNTALVRQGTNHRSSSYISLTPSDMRLATSIAYEDAARMFSNPSVSDPGINFDIETARFNKYGEARPIIRCMSDCDIMYLYQRGPERRSVETPRDLLTNTSHEYYRPPPRRCFSDSCIYSLNAIDEYHYGDDNDFIVHLDSSYDLMPVTNRETKSRVEGLPTGKLTTVSKLSREETSEGVGTDLDEAYKIRMAQNGGALEVSEKEYKLDEGVRQALKNLIADVDKEYGNNTTPVKEEPAGTEEGTDLDEAYAIQMAPNGGALQQPEEEYKVDAGVRHALKNLISDVDKEYGNNTTPVKEEPSGRDKSRDEDEAFKINMDKNGGAAGVSQEDKDFQQALKESLEDTDEMFDINRTPRRRVINFLWQCQEVMFYVLRIYMDNRFY